MRELAVPKLNNNDTSYVLLEWCFAEGEKVPADSAVAVVETSKTAEDLVDADGGVLHRLAEPEAECRPGEVIGLLFDSEAEHAAHQAADLTSPPTAPPADQPVHGAGPLITAPARSLAAELGVDDAALRALPVSVVRRADVARLAADTRGVRHRLPRGQSRVAATVTLSHHTIPAAYLAVRVWLDAALQARSGTSDPALRTVGTTELVVYTIAGLRARYPVFFGAFEEPDAVRVRDGAHVGVTVDRGAGLYVPVLASADTMSLSAIAERVRDFEAAASSGRFTEAELTGANIAVSQLGHTDVVANRPIVFPGHVCMVSLCALRHEVVLDSGGTPHRRPYVEVGLGYDHRAVNGRDAALFLREIKRALESPDRTAAVFG